MDGDLREPKDGRVRARERARLRYPPRSRQCRDVVVGAKSSGGNRRQRLAPAAGESHTAMRRAPRSRNRPSGDQLTLGGHGPRSKLGVAPHCRHTSRADPPPTGCTCSAFRKSPPAARPQTAIHCPSGETPTRTDACAIFPKLRRLPGCDRRNSCRSRELRTRRRPRRRRTPSVHRSPRVVVEPCDHRVAPPRAASASCRPRRRTPRASHRRRCRRPAFGNRATAVVAHYSEVDSQSSP